MLKMKIKKILCVALVATCLTAGEMMSTTSVLAEQPDTPIVAQTNTPTYQVVSKVEGKNVITTLSFTPVNNLGSCSFVLHYNTDKLKLVSTGYGNAQPNIKIISPLTPTDWSKEKGDEPYSPDNNGEVNGTFAYIMGYDDGASDVAVITFEIVGDSFSKDDIQLADYAVSNTDSEEIGNLTLSEPQYSIECEHKSTHTNITKQATCSETGVEDTVCDVCNETVATKEIAKTAHSFDEGIVTTEPNCTEDGVKTYTCTVCGETKTEPVDALGHDYDDGKVTKEPTCDEKGETTFTCTRCGDTYTNEIPAKGHSFDDGTVTTEPTCTEDGVKTYICTDCGETKTESVSALGHDYDSGKVIRSTPIAFFDIL